MIVEILSATAGVGATIWAAFYAERKRKLVKQADQRAVQAEKTVEAVIKSTEEQLLRRIGYKFDYSYCRLDVLDLEGTCRITRLWRGAKVTGALRLPHLRSDIDFTTPGSQLTGLPELIEEVDFPKPVNFRAERSNGSMNKCAVFLDIEGDLTQDDPELSYGYEYVMSRAFLMSREAVLENYKDDFVKDEAYSLVEDVAYKIEIEITFPLTFPVEVRWGVKLRSVDTLHDGEYERIKNNRKRIPRGYRFTVENPLMPFEYFIHWWPPPVPRAQRAEAETQQPKVP
jgi:hypothetical protein